VVDTGPGPDPKHPKNIEQNHLCEVDVSVSAYSNTKTTFSETHYPVHSLSRVDFLSHFSNSISSGKRTRRHWWQPDPEHAPSHALSPDIRSWATGKAKNIVIVVGFLNDIIGESTIVYRVHSCISQLLLQNGFLYTCHYLEDYFPAPVIFI
jgi:hypothetical protein